MTCTSGVWKLDGSQWQVDTNHHNLVEGSLGMYYWEILCLDMITDTTKNEGQNTSSGVWKLDNSHWKVDMHHHNLVDGHESLEIQCLDIIITNSTKLWWSKHCKLTHMSTTSTSGLWIIDGSQWQVDTNNPKLVEGSMGMYHWEI